MIIQVSVHEYGWNTSGAKLEVSGVVTIRPRNTPRRSIYLSTEKGTKTAGKDTIKLTCVLSLTKAVIHLNLATDQEIVLVTMGVLQDKPSYDMYFPHDVSFS